MGRIVGNRAKNGMFVYMHYSPQKCGVIVSTKAVKKFNIDLGGNLTVPHEATAVDVMWHNGKIEEVSADSLSELDDLIKETEKKLVAHRTRRSKLLRMYKVKQNEQKTTG